MGDTLSCGLKKAIRMNYSFVEMLERGAMPSCVLDKYFGQWYDVLEVIGNERKLRPKAKGYKGPNTWVLYVNDDQTDKTGNLFLETWHNADTRLPGWVYSTKARVVAYYALPDTIYILWTDDIRDRIRRLEGRYGEKEIRKVGYTTKGVPVPVATLKNDLQCKVRRLT